MQRVIEAAKLAGIKGGVLQRALFDYKSNGPLTGISDRLLNPSERWSIFVEYYGASAARIAELHYAELLNAALFPRAEAWPNRLRRAIICLRGKRA